MGGSSIRVYTVVDDVFYPIFVWLVASLNPFLGKCDPFN